MKTRTAAGVVTVFAGLALLASCDETPTPSPAKPVTVAPLPQPAAIVAVPGTRPAATFTSKPRILGPLGPAIVVLPAQIAEPQIRVCLISLGEHDGPVSIPRNKYRGSVQSVRLATGRYVAVNTLPLDTYLTGVLAKELYGDWKPEAFRAQAIASRTFALFQMCTDGKSKPWDVNDNDTSQVYGGISGEKPVARAAVAATRGQVLTAFFQGREGIFCARYSACIGGASQDPFDAWGDATVSPLAAHLTGNVDDNCDKYTWDRDFFVSSADLTRCIQNWGEQNDVPALAHLRKIQSVSIAQKNPATHRPTELLLADTAGSSVLIRAEEFRLALKYDPLNRAAKPYSSNFEIRPENDGFLMYNGHGFGHGIGLSQWGAENLATRGYSHAQILAYFYPGAQVRDLW